MISAYPQNNLYGNAWWGIYPPGPAMNPVMGASQPAQQTNPIQQQAPTQQTGGIDSVAFVQGYNAALAYVVPAGKTFLLIDTVEDRIYFKSADIYGRPSPLNDFWLSKEKPEPKEEAKSAPEPEAKAKRDEDDIAARELATKDDIDELRAMIESLVAKKSPGRSRKEEVEDE